MKCCRSIPRCRDCPARKPAPDELRAQEVANDQLLCALGLPAEPPLPPHLRGVPTCLHKYEPLLRRSWRERTPV